MPTFAVKAGHPLFEQMAAYSQGLHERLRRFRHRRVEYRLLNFAPPEAECPFCRSTCKRRAIVPRGPILDAALGAPVYLLVEQGVYRCKEELCPGRDGSGAQKQTYFRAPLPFTVPRGRYTSQARRLGVDAVAEDGLPFSRVARRMAREFLLNPARATIWRWHKAEGEQAVVAVDYQAFTKATFSGVLCLDEMYDKEFAVLVATDPVNDLTVGFRVITGAGERGGVTTEQVADFMEYLGSKGLRPDVLISDESSLYPAALRQVWPEATHQLCIFHFIKQVTEAVLNAVRRYRRSLPKDPTRKRGRPRKGEVVTKHHTEVRRELRENQNVMVRRPRQGPDSNDPKLARLLEAHPPLVPLREFMCSIYEMVAPGASGESAQATRERILSDARLPEFPELTFLLGKLAEDDYFDKITLFTKFTNLPRTSNSAERQNRRIRKRQKSHYRLRLLETLTRALAIDLKLLASRTQNDPVKRLERRPPPASES